MVSGGGVLLRCAILDNVCMATFKVERTITIDRPRDEVHALVNNLQSWQLWSPWEGLDDDLKRSYSGPDEGVGASYSWSGNRKVGRGTMQITSAKEDQIGMQLRFEKPMKADNRVVFSFTEGDNGQTEVSWTMSGEQRGFAAIFEKIMPMDKMVGPDFDKGLTQLKRVAESR